MHDLAFGGQDSDICQEFQDRILNWTPITIEIDEGFSPVFIGRLAIWPFGGLLQIRTF